MFMSHRAWRHAYAAACWQQACSEASSSPASNRQQHSMFSWSSGPTFGVRRPLRHLAWKLNLNETQVRDVVDVLDRLKTAYNQARLDQDRSTSEVAAVFSATEFDSERVSAALATRTRATDVLNQELLGAVKRIFELLSEEQRREFAYLLRSGAFVL
jgi:Spy/CpxP family protein refolding chaperone